MTSAAFAPLRFLLHTIACQLIAALLLIVSWNIYPNISCALVLSSVAAYISARLLEASPPWQLLNGLLPMAIASIFAIALPAWLFPTLFIISVCIYAPAFWTRVPYYPTHQSAYPLILAELPTDRPFTFIDIGCGFGELLFFLKAERPHGRFVGVEIGPLPWLVGKARSLIARGRSWLRGTDTAPVEIYFTSMWEVDLAQYDIVYTFLSPVPMPRLWEKARTEMKPGSLFITNTFPVPARADEQLPIKDGRGSKVYMHRMRGEGRRRTSAV
jgi:hypothetical protein